MGPSIGIVLLAYGSPENLDDLENFLTNILGKPVPQAMVSTFRRRYEQAGGISPLNEITRRQAKALETVFQELGKDYPVFFGMAYCAPWIRDAVLAAKTRKMNHLVGLPMAPHFSKLSSGKYQQFLLNACEEFFPQVQTSFLEAWFDEPGVLEFFTREIQTLLDQLGKNTPVLFSAHSLPQRAIEEGDPYARQVKENAQRIASYLQLPKTQWHQVWQSQHQGGEAWLGPDVGEFIHSLADSKFILCPIGYAADNMEILFDLDIELKGLAEKREITIHRTPLPNLDPGFIRALAHCILQHLARMESDEK